MCPYVNYLLFSVGIQNTQQKYSICALVDVYARITGNILRILFGNALCDGMGICLHS